MAGTNINAQVVNTIVEATISDVTNVTKIETNLSSVTVAATITSGARGRSAYEIWVSEGHTGSQSDFLAWLKSDSYKHIQSVASTVWVINHNLNKRPSVTIVDSADRVVYGEIDYINEDTVEVSFSAAFSGKAYLN